MTSVLNERQAGSITILELSGRLLIGEATEELDEKLQSLLAAGRVRLVLDCHAVTSIDSQGIKCLVRGVISAEKRGGKLKLLRLSHRVWEVLNVTRLLTVIEAFDDEDVALRSFSAQDSVSA